MKDARESSNLYLYARANEIRLLLKNTPFVSNVAIINENKRIIKEFTKEYKTLLKANPNIQPKDDPQFFFIFARAVRLFMDNIKLRAFAYDTLKKLKQLDLEKFAQDEKEI